MTPRDTSARRHPAALTRRLLPTILILALGLTVLLAGLIGLWRVFHRERDQARQTLEQQRQTLEHYARQALEQRLDRDLRAGANKIEEALRDPLLATDHLLSVEAGRQLLPRLISPISGDATPATELYQALLEGKSDAIPTTDPERRPFYREFFAALARSNDREVERTFRELLQHRALYRAAPEHDLPAMLALLTVFHRDSTPAPELLRALLVDGLDDGRGGQLEGLSRLLLAHRNRFTAGDFHFLSERLVDLATRADVPYQPFLERSREHPPAIPLPPTIAAEPDLERSQLELLHAGRWLIRRQPTGLLGIRIELNEALSEVATEMRSRGLLSDDDNVLTANETLADHLTIGDLNLSVDSVRWPRQAAGIEARFRLKAGLLLLSAMLAASMAFLTVAFQARRLRLVELKSEFVATVSHELRTPLASVRLLAETVDRRAKAPELKDYPARIVREIDGLSFLVENILSFNRLERGRVKPRLRRLSLEELIHEIQEDLETQVERRVVIEGPGSQVELTVDRELMKLLLLNLARNAALYNDRQPVRIVVEHNELDAVSEILISDNGRGITKHDRGRIFDQFYRGASGGEASTGTGLGLAICQRVAELHGGEITVAASSSEGTTFRLELPSET